MNNEYTDPELAILENIYDHSRASASPRQRDLAGAAGASLGMTNSILKRLAKRGLITVQRLNSRNIRYAVTPDGMNEIARRSYRYFKRTIKNVVFYRNQVEEALAAAKRRGTGVVLLVGVSDLDFIVEHGCNRHGLTFLVTTEAETAAALKDPAPFVVYAENIPVPADRQDQEAALYLSQILSGRGDQ